MKTNTQTLLKDSAAVRWLTLLLVSLTMFTAYVAADIFSPLKPLLEQENMQYVPPVKALGEYLSRFTPEQVSRQYIDFILNAKKLF